MIRMSDIDLAIRDIGIAVIPPTIVVVLQYARVFLLPGQSGFDVLAHFLGGFAVAWMSMVILERWRRRKWITIRPFIFRDYIVFSSVALIGVIWEFWEFIMQFLTGDMYQPSIADTMNDLFMDLCGAIVLIIAYRILRHIQKSR